MSRSALFKVGKRVLQVVLVLAILGFFVYYVIRDWKVLTSHTFQWNPLLLAVAFLGFTLQEISYGVIWRAVLSRLGARLSLLVSLRIYLASEFVRYIPGNVWHVITRILWVGKYGVSRPVAFASMAVELITKLAAGALVFAVSLLFWPDIGAVRSFLHSSLLVPALGIGTALALLIGLHPRVLNGLLNVALRVLKREPVTLSLRYRDILLVTFMWCVSWCIAGCAFFVLLLALVPAMPLAALPICIGIYAIAWDIGFVAFVTPSGFGFREGAIALLLPLALPSLPPITGTVLAALSRLVSTLAELLCVSVAYLIKDQQKVEIQQEVKELSQQTGYDTLQEVVAEDLPAVPAQARAERGVSGE